MVELLFGQMRVSVFETNIYEVGCRELKQFSIFVFFQQVCVDFCNYKNNKVVFLSKCRTPKGEGGIHILKRTNPKSEIRS